MDACTQGTSGDGSTPSLLDACAASPSAVYNSLYTTTPFRGALAALPIDAAINAPLIDSSPFDLTVSFPHSTAHWQTTTMTKVMMHQQRRRPSVYGNSRSLSTCWSEAWSDAWGLLPYCVCAEAFCAPCLGVKLVVLVHAG